MEGIDGNKMMQFYFQERQEKQNYLREQIVEK